MIKGIFVMHKSGICLYNKSISKSNPDAQLIGGFLSALYKFCKVSIGETISNFCTNSLKFDYFHRNELFFVFISDKSDGIELLPQFRRLMKEFYREFVDQRIIFEQKGLIPELTNFEVCFSSVCS